MKGRGGGRGAYDGPDSLALTSVTCSLKLQRVKLHKRMRQNNMIVELCDAFCIKKEGENFTICDVILPNVDQLECKCACVCVCVCVYACVRACVCVQCRPDAT